MESEKLNKNPNASYNLPVAISSDIATHACSIRMQANILHMLPMQNVIGHNRSVMVAHLIQFFVRKQDKMCYHSTTVLTVNCRVAE